jgi:hypothetical protein
VQALTVVPALFDRRELRVYRGLAGGGFASEPLVLPLDSSVLSLEQGGPGWPLVALTDTGLSALRLHETAAGMQPVLEPLLAARPVLAGSGAFVPRLGMVHDLDADGRPDLLLPTVAGAAVFLAGPDGLGTRQASRVRLPLDDPKDPSGRLLRHYPLPEVRDLDGDGLPELLVPHPRRDWNEPQIWRNLGHGRFAPPVAPMPVGAAPPEGRRHEPAAGTPEVVYLGDVDGDGHAEYVTAESREPGEKASLRENLAYVKRPTFHYRVHPMRPDFSLDPRTRTELVAVGHAFHGDGDGQVSLPGGFQDLDGDGRLDLVTVRLDFSLLQAARVLATKRVSLALDFGLYCQGSDGRFREVRGLDLGGTLQLDLDDLRIERLAQFAGDFDGDGRADFAQIGRGREVTIHRGRPGCVYDAAPDWRLTLDEPPGDLALLQIADWNGDRRSDLLLIRKLPVVAGAPPEERQRVALDLYLSGAGGGGARP